MSGVELSVIGVCVASLVITLIVEEALELSAAGTSVTEVDSLAVTSDELESDVEDCTLVARLVCFLVADDDVSEEVFLLFSRLLCPNKEKKIMAMIIKIESRISMLRSLCDFLYGLRCIITCM